MGLVVVGWEENGTGQGSVDCYWMRMDQCYTDRTKYLVDGKWRNDLREDIQMARQRVTRDCTHKTFHDAGAHAEHHRPQGIEKWVAG